ncbi:MAG: hypothetical protein ACOH2A_13995 [Sphingobacteriaceae bacterium]
MNDCADLRKLAFSNPHEVRFDCKTDIIDNKPILDKILGQTADQQKLLYEFIKQQLGTEGVIDKLDINLAILINILSKDKFGLPSQLNINGFEIGRKISFNDLKATKLAIEQHTAYFQCVHNKYA